jgi:hypothetical protein
VGVFEDLVAEVFVLDFAGAVAVFGQDSVAEAYFVVSSFFSYVKKHVLCFLTFTLSFWQKNA